MLCCALQELVTKEFKPSVAKHPLLFEHKCAYSNAAELLHSDVREVGHLPSLWVDLTKSA